MQCGYVALIGRPNVGKSTLLNGLAGEDISIATSRPETTRDRILGVITRDDVQAVFVDTPGMHRPHGGLGEHMNREARAALDDCDVIVMVADASEGHVGPSRDGSVIETLATTRRPVILALNKVDRVKDKGVLLPLLEAYGKLRDFAEIIPISATNGDGVKRLFELCATRLPEGPKLFPDDTLTDKPERYLAAERIREAVISETSEEVPYVTAVEIDLYDEKAPTLHIRASIHVEREGQKKIVVGTSGERIKAIGTRARHNIEKMIGRKVFLELWVKVTPGWTRSESAMAGFGYKQSTKSKGV